MNFIFEKVYDQMNWITNKHNNKNQTGEYPFDPPDFEGEIPLWPKSGSESILDVILVSLPYPSGCVYIYNY